MRVLFFMFSLFALCSTPALAQTRVWDFRALLDDAPIGYHRFTLTRQGEEGELKSEARFDVKVLFINAYRYVHDATERWTVTTSAGDVIDAQHVVLAVGTLSAPKLPEIKGLESFKGSWFQTQ